MLQVTHSARYQVLVGLVLLFMGRSSWLSYPLYQCNEAIGATRLVSPIADPARVQAVVGLFGATYPSAPWYRCASAPVPKKLLILMAAMPQPGPVLPHWAVWLMPPLLQSPRPMVI